MLKPSALSNEQLLCNRCMLRIGKVFSYLLTRNNMLHPQLYQEALNYRTWIDTNYKERFIPTHSMKGIELDVNNRLIRISNEIFSIADITSYYLPELTITEMEKEQIIDIKEQTEGTSTIMSTLPRKKVSADLYIWIKNFEKPYVQQVPMKGRQWLYSKNKIENNYLTNQYADFKRALILLINEKKNPYIMYGFADLVVDKNPPTFQEGLYFFGYQNIGQVTPSDLKERYNAMINLMASDGLIEPIFVDRANYIYKCIKNYFEQY